MEGSHQKVSLFDGAGGMGAAALNHDSMNNHKEVRGGMAGERQGLSEEDESRVNLSAIDVNESHVLEASVMVYNPVLERQQHQSPIPIVQWERFLPLRTLKVLLVENDDSTRQVVSALLRNCCYEVTAVANALEAWRILEDLTNHIDLILTEVILPCFSGVGLLCKIMSHKTYKTIPVIMMSSNDSMGIVFKCLSKGAVDFLVKPIRKNELKNLWQHVWRRCRSSSGSGSGSGIHGQKFYNSKSEDESGNSTDSNDKEGNDSIGWIARNGSDNGSGTQSSCTKRAIEVDSPHSMSPSKHLSGPHDSTCARVILPLSETFCYKEMPVRTYMDCKEQKKITDGIIGKDLDIGETSKNTGTKQTGFSIDKSTQNGQNIADVIRNVSSNALHEPSPLAVDQPESKDKRYMGLPSIELSLKRLRSAREVGTTPLRDDRTVLKRSNPSAFSRYPSSVASIQAPTGCGGSLFLDNSSEAAPLNQGSKCSSDNNDMGSSNKNCVTNPGPYKEVSTSAIIKCNHPASAFHPVQPQNSAIKPVVQEKIDEVVTAPLVGKSRGSQKQMQVQHHHHHYHHHHHHHVHALPSQPEQEDSSLENKEVIGAFCSSSNVISTAVEANGANYSLNGSNSNSKHGNNGQNECSAAVTVGEMNMESISYLAEKGGVGGGNGSGCGSVTVDQNRCAQREAALNKFRQKRKARNFTKKVRYQSRKRLAEQRPRFHGQFVRRNIHDENI